MDILGRSPKAHQGMGEETGREDRGMCIQAKFTEPKLND